ncbi:MAG TPA: PAS domain S-box protein [Patescibacteria group bacterium]|nr:PAS domain S-box protein [Patescibacteria group bacterium]
MKEEKKAGANGDVLQLIFQDTVTPALIWQRQGKDFVLLEWNAAGTAFVGMEKGAGAPPRSSLFYQDCPHMRERLEECLKQRRTLETETGCRFGALSEERCYRQRCSFIPPDMVLVQMQNWEREWVAVRACAAKEELLKLLSVVTDVALILDQDGRYLQVIPTNPEKLYRVPEDLVGRTVHEIFPAEQADWFRQQIRQALQQGKTLPVEYRLEINGQEVWFTANISPLGKDRVFWVARDTTRQEVAEKQLQLALLSLEQTPDCIIWMDLYGNVFYANPKMCDELGYRREELCRMKVSDFDPQHPPEVWGPEGVLWRERKERMGRYMETQYRRKDGTLIPVEVMATEFFYRDQCYITTIARNISRRQEAEREMQEARERLEEKVRDRTRELSVANQELSQRIEELQNMQTYLVHLGKLADLGTLVAGVAHEINTPVGIGVTAASHLTAVVKKFNRAYEQGNLRRQDLDEFIEDLREAVTILTSNLEKAARLIRSFKQLSASPAGEEKQEFLVLAHLNDLLLSIQPKLKMTKLQVQMDCSADLKLNSYPGAFSQIVTNLILNSAMHGYDAAESGRIHIQAERQNELFILTYTDDGQGISLEIQDKIFEPFFTTSAAAGGTGLGLFIVHNIVVKQLQGQVECSSLPGQGVRFVLSFPG